MESPVVDNPAQHRFEIALSGDDIAAAYYRIDETGRVVLTHTEVPSEYSGRGIGSRLARGTFDAIRASGRKAVLVCPFMAAWYARHPDYSDIVDG
jgi:predicted GNAT family acetyltransferase